MFYIADFVHWYNQSVAIIHSKIVPHNVDIYSLQVNDYLCNMISIQYTGLKAEKRHVCLLCIFPVPRFVWKEKRKKNQWAAKIIIPKSAGEWLNNNICIERDHCSRCSNYRSVISKSTSIVMIQWVFSKIWPIFIIYSVICLRKNGAFSRWCAYRGNEVRIAKRMARR